MIAGLASVVNLHALAIVVGVAIDAVDVVVPDGTGGPPTSVRAANCRPQPSKSMIET